MSDSQEEAFDDGIPAFLKIPQKERNEAAAKLKAQREAEKAAIAIRPDLISPPTSGAPIIVPDKPVKAAIKAETKPVKAKPVATAKKPKATKKAEAKEQPEQVVAKPETETVCGIPHPTTVGGRLVAKPNTKHSTRKISGAKRFPEIAALITNKWMLRSDICKALDVVDNTMRYYIGQMGHTEKYASLYSRTVERSGSDKKQSEYMLYMPG